MIISVTLTLDYVSEWDAVAVSGTVEVRELS
jgi:hypothetical protein